MPSVTVVVPTRNRRELLRDCLRSLLAQTRPAREILVVDNGSSDGTAGTVRSEFPSVRLVLEPEVGVHRARNRALAEARGEIVAFTDDDCLAPPGWLAALGDCFLDPAVACAGGPTRAVWPEARPRPEMLASRRTLFSLGVVDFGPARKDLDPDDEFLPGANLAIRRGTEGAGFRAPHAYGPLGACASDYEMSRRLARERRAVYEPLAFTRHRILAHKLSRAAVLGRVFHFAAAGAKLGARLKPRRGPRELLGWEGAVSAADALGHVYGRLASRGAQPAAPAP